MKITAEVPDGGAVILNEEHNVWASYKVAGVADLPRPEIMYSAITLPDKRTVQFFVNRESGLVVVDVLDANRKGGVELLRRTL